VDLERVKLNLPREKESRTGDGRRYLVIENNWAVRRFLARLFDTICFTSVCYMAAAFLWNNIMNVIFAPVLVNGVPQDQIIPYSVSVCAIPVSLIVGFILAVLILRIVEPGLVKSGGGTPGKGIFGLAVLDAYGEPLKGKAAAKRTAQAWKQGFAYFVPVISQIKAWKAYKALKGGEMLAPWDKDNETVVVCVKPKGFVGSLITATIFAAIFVILAVVIVSEFLLLSFEPSEKQLELMGQAAMMFLG